jgi:cytochrome c553
VTAPIPSIAGQPVTFLENQLIFFREELRNAPVMVPLMKGVKDEEITALARHFSAQPAKAAATSTADAATVARGRELAGKMRCGQCHLPDYRGRNQMPRLAGQREDYTVDTMVGYRTASAPAPTRPWSRSCTASPTPTSGHWPPSWPPFPRNPGTVIAALIPRESPRLAPPFGRPAG